MKWFILAMMYPIAPIMFAILYYHRKSRKNIILGVTLPWESHKNEAVVAIQKSYAKAQKIALLLITLLYIPAILLPEIESMAYQMVWFLVPLVSFYVIYAYYNQKLAHWKKAQPFAQPSEREDLEVEYRPDSKDRDPHPVWFAIPILVAWVPTIRFLLEGADRTLLLVSVISGFTPILCFLIYRTHFSRKKAYFQDTETSRALYLTRTKYWTIYWIVIIWITAILSLLNLWIEGYANRFILSVTVLSLLTLGFALLIELRVMKLQEQLTKASPTTRYDDEDVHWLFGLLYYNQNDKRVLKDERVGIGQTINIATGFGKIMAGFTALALLSLPVIAVNMLKENATPVSLEIANQTLIAIHTGKEYEIPFEDIQAIRKLDALPNLRRTNGTGLENVLKGRFKSEELGNLRINLDPNRPPYLFIQTEDGQYLFGSTDANETEQVYQEILQEFESKQ